VREAEVGLGQLVSRVSSFFGIEPCDACLRRAQALNGVLVFTPHRHARKVVFSSNCTTYKGSCTGFGGNQCVTAPVSLEPDALTVTQCCSSRFQYPWVEVCPGKEPTMGCSFCLF
jgi:hypothetical protein